MTLTNNHITQEALIRRVNGSDGFYLFTNHLYQGYHWELTNRYDHPSLMYNQKRSKNTLSKYDPEKNGTIDFLSHSETNIHNIYDTIQCESHNTPPLNELQVNQLILKGIEMIGRFSAMKVLEEHGLNAVDGECFEEIIKSLIDHSELLIKLPNTNWEDIWKGIIIFNKGMAKYTTDNFVGKLEITHILYDEHVVIMSDCPVYYSHSLIIYPISSKELISIRIRNQQNDDIIDYLISNPTSWINMICQNSHLYLMAHRDTPQHIMNVITNCYKQYVYKLIQL